MRKFIDYIEVRDPLLAEEILNEISAKQLAGLGVGATLGLMGTKAQASEEDVAARDPDTGKWSYVNPADTEVKGGTRFIKKGVKQVVAFNNATGKYQLEDEGNTEMRGNRRFVKSGGSTSDPLNKFADKGAGELEDSSLPGFAKMKADLAQRAKEGPAQTDEKLSGAEKNDVLAYADRRLGAMFDEKDILAKKFIIPYEHIRAAQKDKAKWDRDFENLKSAEKDIGMSTHKSMFNKEVLLVVVSDEGMNKAEGRSTEAFALANKLIVLRKSAFKDGKLPTENSDRELTLDGASTIAHEFRHFTQLGKPPEDQSFWGRKGGTAYSAYMRDPREMGVRLAALKNLMTKDSIRHFLDNAVAKENLAYKNTYAEQYKVIADALHNVFEEDFAGVDLLLNYEKWAKKALESMSPEQKGILEKMTGKADPKYTLQEFIKSMIMNEIKSDDITSIFSYYINVTNDTKSDIMKYMKDGYDTVVKGKQQDQDLRATLDSQNKELRARLAQRLRGHLQSGKA